MSPQERTIDLIKKLLLKANDKAVTAEESAAFASKANELLLKHKLSMTDLEFEQLDTDDAMAKEYFDPSDVMRWVGKGRRSVWLENLVEGITRANFCRILVIPGSKKVAVLGRVSDIAIAKYLTHVLVREAERLSVLYERQERVGAERQGLPMPKEPKKAFLLGFTDAVLERLQTIREQVQQQGGKHAVVRFQQADHAVQAFFDKGKYDKAGGFGNSARTGNLSAWEAGRKAGKTVDIQSGLNGGAAGKQGTLHKGSNLLGGGK